MCKCLCANVRWVSFVCFLVLFLTKDCIDAHQTRSPSRDFSSHRLVTPVVHHARTKRELSTTRDSESNIHHPEVTLTVEADGEQYVLDLRLNEELIAENHVIRYHKDGTTVTHKPKKEDLNICQYNGGIRGKAGSWAAVSTCHGIRGVLYDGITMKYIEPVEGNSIQSAHYMYDHKDMQTEHKCGYTGGVTNNSHFDPTLLEEYRRNKEAERSRISRYKRSTEEVSIRGPYNANKLSRYVELVLVADNREFRANGENIHTVHHQMKDVANIINSIYSQLNIFIALVGVVVWSERDEIQLLENGDDTLTNFLTYRKQLIAELPNDNAQLLTRQQFNNGVVGKALKGPICTYEFSGGVSTNHSEVIGLVATTIAHEMGHNFGMEHDTQEDCTCPDEKCIMSPSSTSVMPTHWSSCSLKSLALAFERGMDYCLRNKPKKLFDSPTCGNGFLEPGEQCDCGTSTDNNDCRKCCQDDCLLRSNATCATGQCCDLETCRPKRAGTVCRESARSCDLPEYCSGHSAYCPRDVFAMDAVKCGDSHKAYCVGGYCRSHTDQCRLLWGFTGKMSHENCYKQINVKNNPNGNCGYDRVNQVYRPCAPQDAFCGRLHCVHLNEQLQFGMDSVANLAQTFINNNGSIAPCRTAIIDLGLDQVDPGLVPDGAACGDNMMCMSQKCVPVESILEQIRVKPGSVCPSDCSGHGVCNSEGHCHCEVGFAPPFCALPGPGGSYDSGPATDPTLQRNFMVAMYVIFLGILPSILLVLFLVYYSRHNVLTWWKRPKKSAQSPKKTSLQHRISRSASKFAANFHGSSSGAGNAQPVNVHTLSSPDDMSSSLLRSDSDRSPSGTVNPTVNFFGNFKGFSLTPVEKNQQNEETKNEPVVNKSAKITPVHRNSSVNQSVKPILRSAPPLPVVPVTSKSSPKSSPSVKRTNSSVQDKIKAFMNADKTEDVQPVTNARPVISSPILEASTCTAKELISPLQGSKTLGPVRAAPRVPGSSPDLPKRPLSMHSSGNVPQKPLPEEPKKVKEGISLNRIASFLKQEKPKEKERNPVERSHSLPKNPNHQIRQKVIDKVALRNLQISNPILQKEIDLPVNTVPVVSDSEDGDDPKAFVNRAQSMRGGPVTQKPVIHSFGSMRQAPGVPRPASVVGRPTAPPPPLPAHSADHAPVYQNPKPDNKCLDYVDCIEEKQAPLAHIDEEATDNIYAIIEESPEKHSKPLPGVPPPIRTIPQEPPEGYNTPKPITSLNSGSTESMGLLGEIVNEIQNRNMDSIYSASTLLRRKKEKEAVQKRDSTYTNTDHYKTPESVYSNSGAKSTTSTTSSGYLHPSAVNVPTFDVKQPEMNEKAPPSPTMKVNSKIPTFSRQVTPPTLKNTSTFRNVPSSPKNIPKSVTNRPISANSPDLVSSCAVIDTKPPDVINNNKTVEPPKVSAKPTTTKPNDNRPPVKTTIVDKRLTKTTPSTIQNKPQLPPLNKVTSKVDSNVKAIADNLNKNKPKIVPKPSTVVQRTDSNVKPSAKLTSKPSNVASLQQKFENRKSVGREPTKK